MSRFLGQAYWYATPEDGRREIGVVRTPAGTHIVAWIDDEGCRRRVATTNLPPMDSPHALQRALDIWAYRRGLDPAADPGQGADAATKEGGAA